MNSATLLGANRQVYALIKVLKYCTGSSAKSYECKFAVHLVLAGHQDIPRDKIGQAIRKVINYKNIRGKFDAVHQDLKDLGVTRIEIGDIGLNFEGNSHSNFFS